MTDVTVLGLGLMGSALADSLQQSGRRICVWNRSNDKMARFVSNGAVAAASIREAIKTSPYVIVCVSDYDTSWQLLGSDEAKRELNEHTVIQLSTGTPQEALESERRFNDCGATYLDGAILSSPSDILSNNGRILIGGNEAAWIKSEPLLRCITESITYAGESVRAPAILDFAWLTYRLALYLGLFSGVMLCEEAGINLDHYSSIVEDDRMRQVLKTIQEEDFQNPSVTVNVYLTVLKNIQKHAVEAGVELELLNRLRSYMEKACDEGYGDEDIASLVKIFRAMNN